MFPVISKGTVIHRIPAGALLVNLGSFSAYEVNTAGLAMLLLCDGTRNIEEISGTIFPDDDHSRAKLSASRMIADFCNKGLLFTSDSVLSDVIIKVSGDGSILFPLCRSVMINDNIHPALGWVPGRFGMKNIAPSVYLDRIRDLVRTGALSLTLTGKEPLLHPEFVNILKAACQVFHFVVIESKLKGLNQTTADEIVKFKKNMLFRVKISAKSEISGRKELLAATKNLRSKGMLVEYYCIMNKKNIGGLREIADIAAMAGISRLAVKDDGSSDLGPVEKKNLKHLINELADKHRTDHMFVALEGSHDCIYM
jgi:hypothetical protein